VPATMPLNARRHPRLATGVLALLLLPACGGAPQDPVDRLIHDVSNAVEDRDAEAVGARVADDFQGQGGTTRADVIATVRRYFAAYEKLGVNVFDVQRVDEKNLKFRVDFTGKPRDVGGLAGLLPSAAVYQFEVELTGSGDALKVRRGTWREWQPAASP
jgi:hypothetical protein